MKTIYWFKCGFKHALGNWIQSWIALFDAVIGIITFGHALTRILIWWVFKRQELGLYGHKEQKDDKD